MAALVAAALGQVGDRPAWLAAILADRCRTPSIIILAAALALAVTSGVAAAGGALIGPRLTPDAARLLLALALGLQGAGSFWPVKPPDPLTGWRLGAGGTSLFGLTILLFGDGVTFVVLALAARTPVPALAAAGATLGGLAVLAAAALLGEGAWRQLPLAAARRAIGALFLLAGLVMALGALRLI